MEGSSLIAEEYTRPAKANVSSEALCAAILGYGALVDNLLPDLSEEIFLFHISAFLVVC